MPTALSVNGCDAAHCFRDMSTVETDATIRQLRQILDGEVNEALLENIFIEQREAIQRKRENVSQDAADYIKSKANIDLQLNECIQALEVKRSQLHNSCERKEGALSELTQTEEVKSAYAAEKQQLLDSLRAEEQKFEAANIEFTKQMKADISNVTELQDQLREAVEHSQEARKKVMQSSEQLLKVRDELCELQFRKAHEKYIATSEFNVTQHVRHLCLPIPDRPSECFTGIDMGDLLGDLLQMSCSESLGESMLAALQRDRYLQSQVALRAEATQSSGVSNGIYELYRQCHAGEMQAKVEETKMEMARSVNENIREATEREKQAYAEEERQQSTVGIQTQAGLVAAFDSLQASHSVELKNVQKAQQSQQEELTLQREQATQLANEHSVLIDAYSKLTAEVCKISNPMPYLPEDPPCLIRPRNHIGSLGCPLDIHS